MRPTSEDLRKPDAAARLADSQSMEAVIKRFRIPRGFVRNIPERQRNADQSLAPSLWKLSQDPHNSVLQVTWNLTRLS